MWIGRLLFIAIFLAGCAHSIDTEPPSSAGRDHQVDKSLSERRDEAIAAFDHKACAVKNGSMTIEGLLGMPRCTISFEDEGARCSDSDDCLGRCLARDDVTDFDAPSGQVMGVCAATDSPFGCYATITKGSLDPAICVD